MQTGGSVDREKDGVWTRSHKTGGRMDRGEFRGGKGVGVWVYFDDADEPTRTKAFG